jgi:uncharacterized membrane protein
MKASTPHISTSRLEAFSDGVLAIIITIMVLELKVPHGDSPATLAPLIPVFLSYLLSFANVGIYWNNHHHLLHACRRVTGPILWANLHLLFWLSLIPFATGWMGQNHFTAAPAALYGIVLLMSGLAYLILQRSIMAAEGADSVLRHALGSDLKGKLSLGAYVLAVSIAWVAPVAAMCLYVLVALSWFVPDRRIEKALALHDRQPPSR